MIEKVKLESKNHEFFEKIKEMSGEDITVCDQCGICSGSCPFTDEMDITPSTIMKKVQLGITDVLDAKTIWICASCLECMTRCPRGLDLPKVAESLRQVNLRKAIDKIDVHVVDKEELKHLPPIAFVGSFRKLTS